MNEKDIKRIIAEHSALQEHAAKIACALWEMRTGHEAYIYSDDISFGADGQAEADWKDHHRDEYTKTLVIPAAYLFDDHWRDTEQALIDMENKKQVKIAERLRKTAEAKHEKNERANLERLRKKYDGDR